MNEVLCLKWNNHKSIFLQNLSNLRTQELYSDATISCGGKYFLVHRLVLSTCSEYFEELFFKINAQSVHPFIILTNIESGFLEALLNFMYNGEVNVLHEMLPGLIKAAEYLKIKGLAIPDEEAIEKELMYARDREVSSVNIEQTPSQQLSSTSAIPTSLPIVVTPQAHTATSKSTHAHRELIVSESPSYIVPDDIHRHISLPPVATLHENSSIQIEPNFYQTKQEIVEFGTENHPGTNYASNRQQEQVMSPNQDEIKIEGEINASQPEPIHHVLVSTFNAQSHSPTNNTQTTPSLPHFSSPSPSRSQPMSVQEAAIGQEASTIIYSSSSQHSVYNFAPREVFKVDLEANQANTHAKVETWDVPMNNKDMGSNTAAAAVVQEVIQGLLQPEAESGIGTSDDSFTSPRQERLRRPPATIKTEEPISNVRTRTRKTPELTSQSPKKCPKCPYITKYASTLRRHVMFKHTGEKPHQCKFCPYRSAHDFNMKKHMMTHTGEKPFSCPLCSYKATQNCNIKAHMKSHQNKLLRAAIQGTKKPKQ